MQMMSQDFGFYDVVNMTLETSAGCVQLAFVNYTVEYSDYTYSSYFLGIWSCALRYIPNALLFLNSAVPLLHIIDSSHVLPLPTMSDNDLDTTGHEGDVS